MKTRSIAIALTAFLACVCASAAPKAVKLPKGCTVYGKVECDGAAMAGVAVSDGTLVAVTDAKGRYFLNSDKKNGTVFVSIPSCTEVETESGMPHFWEPLGNDSTPEQHDFSLRSVDNRRHAVIAVSDIHLANIFDDKAQFEDIFMPRVREEVAKYRSQGIPVYCVNGGDSSYDRYWYENLYAIEDFPATLNKVGFPVPMFATMGNHDNDGATAFSDSTDFEASSRYRATMGPTHYSFNLGDIHYVMLDNVVYLNSPGRIDSYEGITGKRDYEAYISPDQLEWLRRDLSLVSDKSTPIVITMHVPMLAYKVRTGEITTRFRSEGTDPADKVGELTTLLKDFEQVHLITGHTHRNMTCHGSDSPESLPYISNIIDHNITGACGCWWQTVSHNGLSLAPDSAPSGFEVFPVDGKSLEWYFVSNDDGAGRQFRVFDMNSVRDYYRTNGEIRSFLRKFDQRTDYAKIDDNMVYIHVWAWEPTWKVSVRENGRELEVKDRNVENPQFTISQDLPKAGWDDNKAPRWQEKHNKPSKMDHFFVVRASSADSTLEVCVTDGFGHSWTETVTRPKAFSKKMR